MLIARSFDLRTLLKPYKILFVAFVCAMTSSFIKFELFTVAPKLFTVTVSFMEFYFIHDEIQAARDYRKMLPLHRYGLITEIN